MKLSIQDLHERICRIDSIPTIPTIIQPLLAMLRSPAESVPVQRVQELVSCDESIAAQCLKIANSPLFGTRRLDNIGSAISLLGLRRVQSILLSCSLNSAVPKNLWGLPPTTFWRHSFGCALVSRKLAEFINYPDPEKAYLAGLLHDIGIIVSSIITTEQFRQCLAQAASNRATLNIVEEEILGFTHCHSGSILARQWKLPEDLVTVIEFHHNPQLQYKTAALTCLVHLSDLLCRLRDLGYGYDENLQVDFQEDFAWQFLAANHPVLFTIDLARFTLEIDNWMREVSDVVDNVFVSSTVASGD